MAAMKRQEAIRECGIDFADRRNLVLPQGGGFKPASRPSKDLNKLNPRITGLPHSSMAAITLCRSAASQSKDESPTPLHLRHNLPPLVEFTSHVQPPSKVHDSQIMVQVYAVAVDYLDVAVLDDKTNADVRKYIPGRSFVGRCLAVGSHEKEIVRGDLVIGLVDIKKVSWGLAVLTPSPEHYASTCSSRGGELPARHRILDSP